jgi:hypothetical protein
MYVLNQVYLLGNILNSHLKSIKSFLVLETESHYVAQDDLKLTM